MPTTLPSDCNSANTIEAWFSLMIKTMKQIIFIFFLCTGFAFVAQNQVPAPLFIDTQYYGSCDPEIVFNPGDNYYYIYYTSRRALTENLFVATPIGVARSADLINWHFAGYCKFDGAGGTKDASATYWAPGIIVKDKMLHMFVTYKPDTTTYYGAWGGPGKIVHYQTSVDNPVNGWRKVADLHDTTIVNSLDATVFKKEDGQYHIWFKGKEAGDAKNNLFHYVSPDLMNWAAMTDKKSDVFNGKATGQPFEEAPYVFYWKSKYWLLTDPHKGFMVYESDDAAQWKFQGFILNDTGNRKYDNSLARHCSVLIKDDRAFIVYHVEPRRDYNGISITKQPMENKKAVLQMAELKLIDGRIICDRNELLQLKKN